MLHSNSIHPYMISCMLVTLVGSVLKEGHMTTKASPGSFPLPRADFLPLPQEQTSCPSPKSRPPGPSPKTDQPTFQFAYAFISVHCDKRLREFSEEQLEQSRCDVRVIVLFKVDCLPFIEPGLDLLHHESTGTPAKYSNFVQSSCSKDHTT